MRPGGWSGAVLDRVAGVAALGAMLTALSEMAFYPVALDEGLAVMVLAYGLLGWLAVGALAVARRDDRAAWWIAGGLVGFLAEGVVVGQLYAEWPLSIVWTPLAWHAAVSVMVGIVAVRAALDRGAAATLADDGRLGRGAGALGGVDVARGR